MVGRSCSREVKFHLSNWTWPLRRYCVLLPLSGSSWMNSLSFRLLAPDLMASLSAPAGSSVNGNH